MNTHELSEFTFLLKLGLWSGGAVPGLGYVSAADDCSDDLPMAGLAGLPLGGGVMLESADEQRLILSVYDPYAGGYRSFAVSADFDAREYSGRPVTMARIEKVLAGTVEKEAKSGGRGRTFREYTSLRDKRRYEASYTSYRTGRIPTPGHRK